ncbi:MAG: helix-turn-helix domain-containing protein [Gammaproteobacteria bacterium]
MESPSGPLTLGEQLCQARAARGLSHADVAALLRLPLAVVAALEQGRYHEVPPAFVRGYLRAYAKAVGIDAGRLLEQEGLVCAEPPPLVPCSPRRAQPGYTAATRYARAVGLLVVAALAVLFVASWQRMGRGGPPVDLANAIRSYSATVRREAVTPAPPDRAVSGLGDTDPVVPPADASAHELSSGGGEAAAGADRARSVTQTAPARIERPRTAASLVLQLNGDSWTEVTDAQGEQLYSAMASEGQTISLDGPEPFQVVLGNAPGVSVFYKGQPLDVSRWQRGRVARFKIGGEGGGP